MFSEYFGSQLTNFHESLSPKFNRDMVFKAGEGAGRSGSFFFFSHDRKFIIKTMTQYELDLFLDKLTSFKDHFRQNPDSLLAKIFGVFTINTDMMKKVHVMLMENTAQFEDPKQLRSVFDLKGSLVDRKEKGITKPSTTLKDQNFIAMQDQSAKRNKKNNIVNLSNETKKKILATIKSDVEFLKGQYLMDYSLLICIEKRLPHDRAVNPNRFSLNDANASKRRATKDNSLMPTLSGKEFTKFLKQKHSFVSGNFIYHIAVIDYLQEWNLNKKAERFIKTNILMKDRKMLSAIEPIEYARRF